MRMAVTSGVHFGVLNGRSRSILSVLTPAFANAFIASSSKSGSMANVFILGEKSATSVAAPAGSEERAPSMSSGRRRSAVTITMCGSPSWSIALLMILYISLSALTRSARGRPVPAAPDLNTAARSPPAQPTMPSGFTPTTSSMRAIASQATVVETNASA